MPFYEECGVNQTPEAMGEINVTSFVIPDNPGDVFVYVEGRLLAHKLQWLKTGAKQIACLPIKPGDQWHIKVWQETAQAAAPQKHQARQIFRAQPNYEISDDFDAGALSDPSIQEIFNKAKPPGGYVSDNKNDNYRGGYR